MSATSTKSGKFGDNGPNGWKGLALKAKSGADAFRIYDPAGLPLSWVVENENTGELFIVPAVTNGWTRRIPFHGHRESVHPVPGYAYMGLGVPLQRHWPDVCADRDGRN